MNRALLILAQKNVRLIKPVARNFTTSPVKLSGQWIYRESGAKYMPKSHIMKAEIIGAIMWWWILYHIWTEPEHILGDFPYPDPSKWSDAELGITSE